MRGSRDYSTLELPKSGGATRPLGSLSATAHGLATNGQVLPLAGGNNGQEALSFVPTRVFQSP